MLENVKNRQVTYFAYILVLLHVFKVVNETEDEISEKSLNTKRPFSKNIQPNIDTLLQNIY